MTPESVGANGSSLVIGKHSGRNAIGDKLRHLGFGEVEKGMLCSIFDEVKAFADAHKIVPDSQIEKIAHQFQLRRLVA